MKKALGAQGGFTLIELIIVIVILGILAAIAIPMFSTSSKDARESSLKSDLAVLRHGIQVYYHEHNGNYPGALKTDGSGTATVAGDLPAAFTDQMTLYTNKAGKTSATKDDVNYPYGPYLSGTTMPVNPLPVGTASGVGVTADTGSLTVDASPTTEWKYSKVTGQIIANNATYSTW